MDGTGKHSAKPSNLHVSSVQLQGSPAVRLYLLPAPSVLVAHCPVHQEDRPVWRQNERLCVALCGQQEVIIKLQGGAMAKHRPLM